MRRRVDVKRSLTSRETGLSSGAIGEYSDRRRPPRRADVPAPRSRLPRPRRRRRARRPAHAPARVRRRRGRGRARARRAARLPRARTVRPSGRRAELEVLARARTTNERHDGRGSAALGGRRRRPRPTWGLARGRRARARPHRAAPDRRRAPLRGDARLGRAPARGARGQGPAPRPGARPGARCATSPTRRRCSSGSRTRSSCARFGAVPDGRFPHLVLEHLDGPTLDELLAARRGRWRSSRCCRSRCTSRPRCTTWPPRASCTSTSSRATS